MKLVLLAGGSGKRLWPFSHHLRSKPFLKIFHHPKGEKESMVQRTWRKLEEHLPSSDAYIATSQTHVDLVHDQLGTEVPLIIEPEPRDTFPAIALAATYFYSKQRVDCSDVITVMPVDFHADDAFFVKMKQLEEVIHHSGAALALIGIAPSYPSSQYGYIVPSGEQTDLASEIAYQKVQYFKEKPQEREMHQLFTQCALWNSGIFAFRLGDVIQELAKRGWPTDYEKMLQEYGNLPKISFDYEIVENASQAVVIPYSGFWKDLGTWNEITQEMDGTDEAFAKCVDCKNVHILNELEIPVVTIGVSDVVVAASPDGILVADKAKSNLVKNAAPAIAKRVKYEERGWGWSRVLDDQNHEALTRKIHLRAGKHLSYRYHTHCRKVWIVAAGEGELVLNGRIFSICPGAVWELPAGARHAVIASKDLDIIEVQFGNQSEEDTVHLALSWEEIRNGIQKG